MSSVEGSDKQEDSLSQELQIVLKQKKIHKNKSSARNSKGLNTEDNLYNLKQYMFGRFDIAAQSCKKMIASNPENPEPYFLMATMHQQAATRNKDDNQLNKSVQYFFFHAYYSPPSVQKWLKVADMSYDLQLYQQAAYCYGRALKMNKGNLEINLRRAQCLQLCLQIKKAANIYKRIIENISASQEVYKRYAKLRFKRQQYGKARQILLECPSWEEDLNIKFMVAETLLKQGKFKQLFRFIEKQIIEQNSEIQNIYQDLEIQFLHMIFVCKVCEPDEDKSDLQIEQMIVFLQKQYTVEESSAYEEIIGCIKSKNAEITFRLLSFLLSFEPHRKVENYLYCSEYLTKLGEKYYNQAIQILEKGLSYQKNRYSIELKTQLNYLKTLVKFKKGRNENKTENRKAKSKKIDHQIFYSDEEGSQVNHKNKDIDKQIFSKSVEDIHQEDIYYDVQENLSQDLLSKNKKIKKTRKVNKTNFEIKDPDIVSKLISNNKITLYSLKEQVQKLDKDKPKLEMMLLRTFPELKHCLNYLVQIHSNRQEQDHRFHPTSRNQSIFNNKQPKRRRIISMYHGRKNNIISKNSIELLQSLRTIIFFMREYVKLCKYTEVIEFTQLLSKAHFFKWQNRITDFKTLKKEVYQIGLLACLELKKYGKSIFFLRYLINKNPLNEFYLSIAQKIMRLSSGKLFINKMLKLDNNILSEENQQLNGNRKELVNIYYMTGVEYMQNCFFELAINMFSKVINILEQKRDWEKNSEEKQICKTTYLCMSTCFLQISSSRTVFNKLDHVNRSAYCLGKYKGYESEDCWEEAYYNQARWYSYIKLFFKAIPLYEQVIERTQNLQLKWKCLINLMVILKNMENYERLKEVSTKYFSEGGLKPKY